MAGAFASVEDYEARNGEFDDRGRLSAALDDASALMESAYMGRYGKPYMEGSHRRFDLNACAVCCAVASRALSASALMGISQHTETAGSYSESMTFANPSGDMYLSKTDLRRLGLAGCTVRSVPAAYAIREEATGDGVQDL